MSVPLDRLYNYVDGLCNHDIIIYRFFPHGSKKLEDLLPINAVNYANSSWSKDMLTPVMICHDQEPLHYDLYSQDDVRKCAGAGWTPLLKEIASTMHLRGVISLPQRCYDLTLLCHSELNSPELPKFEDNGFVGVYWWSHGIIAQDWFRYAQHDLDIEFELDSIKYDFLIYNRAWAGTREYRLKFIDLVANNNLIPHCQTTFSAIDNNVHYTDHQFDNQGLTPSRWDFEKLLSPNVSTSSASADYESSDYKSSAIEVVLETLFDDTRLHLTEKALRPIACGRPFILCATAGSLQYLREYGIKTFDGLIDESYDLIQDPVLRLKAIVSEMKRIADLPTDHKQQLWIQLNGIAAYNKNLFFSTAWQERIVSEFMHNLSNARSTIETGTVGSAWCKLLAHGVVKDRDIPGFRTQEDIKILSDWLAARGVTAPLPHQD
jgi:hypothetical protein